MMILCWQAFDTAIQELELVNHIFTEHLASGYRGYHTSIYNLFTIPTISMATFLPQLYPLETNGSPHMGPYGKAIEVFESIKAQ